MFYPSNVHVLKFVPEIFYIKHVVQRSISKETQTIFYPLLMCFTSLNIWTILCSKNRLYTAHYKNVDFQRPKMNCWPLLMVYPSDVYKLFNIWTILCSKNVYYRSIWYKLQFPKDTEEYLFSVTNVFMSLNIWTIPCSKPFYIILLIGTWNKRQFSKRSVLECEVQFIVGKKVSWS